MGESSNNSICIDIDEFASKLSEMKEDGYETVRLTFSGDMYSNELEVDAIGIDSSDDSMSYGTMCDVSSEFI